jgi:histidine triad (HIT) family protein
MASCLFCSIIAGEVAAFVVEEDERAIVFLDHRPVFPGHCLVVPKTHYQTLSDLPEGEVGSYFQLVQRVTRAVETALAADGTFVAINNRVSQSVPHLHVHVVPRRQKDGLRGFFWPRQKYGDEAAALAMRDSIRNALKK